MRTAFEYAMEARQELHVSGFSPYRARSWLISACCVDPMTIVVVATGREAAAGALCTLGFDGFGLGLGLGTTIATSDPLEATRRSAANVGLLWEGSRRKDGRPAATATKRIKA